MSEVDHVLGLVDDLLRLVDGSDATAIEVEADGFAVTVTRSPQRQARVGDGRSAGVPRASSHIAPTRPQARVHASTVGIFSAAREWSAGDTVARGAVLGGIQSLGHVAELIAPADGRIAEVLVSAGAPVEFGQALFVIDATEKG